MDETSIAVVPPDVRERVTRLLCDLVAIPSHGCEEQAVIRYLADRFTRQGIPWRIGELDGTPINVIAEIGAGPRVLVLNSHHDTVPPGDPALAPWRTWRRTR